MDVEGMAMRLSFDLGLHINCDPYINSGLIAPSAAEARQSTFWSCHVVN